MELVFDAVILQNEDMDAAYVEVPYDIKAEQIKANSLTGILNRVRFNLNATCNQVLAFIPRRCTIMEQ